MALLDIYKRREGEREGVVIGKIKIGCLVPAGCKHPEIYSESPNTNTLTLFSLMLFLSVAGAPPEEVDKLLSLSPGVWNLL